MRVVCGEGGVVCERDVSVHVWRRGVWCVKGMLVCMCGGGGCGV